MRELKWKGLAAVSAWSPPAGWLKVTTIDAHTGGEPFRVITGGMAEPEGETILGRRRWAAENLDHLRRALMWEPRGHADMYGCIVTAPCSPGADLGVLFIHNEGYSTMCGHGIIALVTVALETGMIELERPETRVGIDTPAGRVDAVASVSESGRVRSVRFRNVPSFVLQLDGTVDVEGLGEIRYDLAFGGAFYAFVRAEDAGLRCRPEDFGRLIDKGMAIKRAVMGARPIDHPFEPDLGFLYGTIFTGPAELPGSHSRNVCVFAEGEVDRSPTGTGVSARLAIHHRRGEIGVGEPIVIESIVGSRFTGKVAAETSFGPHPAIIPEVEGSAFITGRHEFLISPEDEFAGGFFLR